MMEPSTPSPKRKRPQDFPVTPIKFSFDVGRGGDAADFGSDSPRTCVAHKFRGLALAGDDEDEGRDWTRKVHFSPLKRQKPDEIMMDAPPLTDMSATDSNFSAGFCGNIQSCSETAPAYDAKTQVVQVSHMEPTGNAVEANFWGNTHTLPIIGSQFKPPQCTRAGTPLKMGSSPAEENMTQNDVPQVVDPVRAALTWHEDEITIYDPNDADDDGTGINGIGFKPTPALAHVRALKRRQQLAEYRRREENDARALRSERRRNGTSTTAAGVTKRKSPTRRVRFVDTEMHKIAVTTI